METNTHRFGQLEVTLFEVSGPGYVFRIGRPGDQPTKVTDGFYPRRDLGLLWVRWVDGHLACSGMLSDEVFDEGQLSDLIDFIDERFLRTDHQVDYQIDLVARTRGVVESGEESLRF